MSFYRPFPKGVFQSGSMGSLLMSTEVLMPVKTNKREYPLREKSSVERNFVVGIWVNAPEETAQKADETTTIINRAAFNSTYLNLKVNTTTIYEKVSLLHIEKCNAQGRPYYVELGAKVNLSESKLECNNAATIGTNEVISLRFDYVIPLK